MSDPIPETLSPELARTFEALGIELERLQFRGDTIVADTTAPQETVLPSLLESLAPGASPQLVLGATLGEGGMGVVREATQTALGREVAVKMLRPERDGPSQANHLLREARVTGRLEHPNVVPVYALGRDEDDRPILVMKRIEGTAWRELLEGVPLAERSSEAYLSRHLGILRQVATAIEFAHSRGVLHRDLKPDNVMIGAFGEVYVVDWGIAVGFGDELPESVPRVEDVLRLEGTPFYMAPEMVMGDGATIGPASDVYLLGATLHHVITGEPPHLAMTLQQSLMRAWDSRPPIYDATVPRELAAIATRAMARDPAARWPSAAAFGAALDAFATHRGSLELCDEAERRVDELWSIVEREEPLDEAAQARVEALFHEARFAFDQALRTWSGNEVAKDGLHELLEHMARFELGRGAPRAALRALRPHESPPPELEKKIADAIAALDAQGERLRALEHDADRGIGVATRTRRVVVAAIGWGLTCFACGALTRYDIFPIDHWRLAFCGLVLLVANLAWAYRSRHQMLANVANRNVVFTTTLTAAAGTVLWPALGLAGVPMPQATAIGLLVLSMLWATMIAHMGRAWIPMAAGHLVAAGAIALLPDYAFEIYGLTAIPTLVTGYLMARQIAAAPA